MELEQRFEDHEAKEKERQQKDMIVRWIPKAYLKIESDKFNQEYLNKNIFLYGPAGTGKTTLACHIARESAKTMFIRYYSYPALIMQLQSAFRNQTLDPFNMAREIARFPGLLVLDDIGAEKLTDYVRQITYYIINEREQWELKTVITSNFSLAELDDFIDQRIASRIAGMCLVLEVPGKDRRIR